MGVDVLSESATATARLGEMCGKRLSGGMLVLLTGELGAGKTVFAKGIAKGAGVAEEVTSPSFNLMLRYSGRIGFDHWDLYRLEILGDDEEFLESAYDNNSITVVEWGERLSAKPDLPTLSVSIGFVDGADEMRLITLDGDDRIMDDIAGPAIIEWEGG